MFGFPILHHTDGQEYYGPKVNPANYGYKIEYQYDLGFLRQNNFLTLHYIPYFIFEQSYDSFLK